MADSPRIRLLGFAPKVRKASTRLKVIPFSYGARLFTVRLRTLERNVFRTRSPWGGAHLVEPRHSRSRLGMSLRLAREDFDPLLREGLTARPEADILTRSLAG